MLVKLRKVSHYIELRESSKIEEKKCNQEYAMIVKVLLENFFLSHLESIFAIGSNSVMDSIAYISSVFMGFACPSFSLLVFISLLARMLLKCCHNSKLTVSKIKKNKTSWS